MTNILVRDVPDDVHSALQRKAARQQQSLQQFLSTELTRVAHHRSVGEVLDEVETKHGGRVGLAVAAADLDSDRAQR